tara:strand:+ start:582 stop:731 length:150 start_codon:yes stop_codon:yes gene_type:complete
LPKYCREGPPLLLNWTDWLVLLDVAAATGFELLVVSANIGFIERRLIMK